MTKLTPVEAKKLLQLANDLAKAGIPFVVIPAISDKNHEDLLLQSNEQFRLLFSYKTPTREKLNEEAWRKMARDSALREEDY